MWLLLGHVWEDVYIPRSSWIHQLQQSDGLKDTSTRLGMRSRRLGALVFILPNYSRPPGGWQRGAWRYLSSHEGCDSQPRITTRIPSSVRSIRNSGCTGYIFFLWANPILTKKMLHWKIALFTPMRCACPPLLMTKSQTTTKAMNFGFCQHRKHKCKCTSNFRSEEVFN